MPAVSETLRVEGYRELQRAFSLADRKVKQELNGRLREAVEPVRTDAESLASSRIRNIGTPWSRMRIGVTATSVYVAPRERGVKRTGDARKARPNLAGLLLGRAMEPALADNVRGVEREVGDLLDEMGREWERVG